MCSRRSSQISQVLKFWYFRLAFNSCRIFPSLICAEIEADNLWKLEITILILAICSSDWAECLTRRWKFMMWMKLKLENIRMLKLNEGKCKNVYKFSTHQPPHPKIHKRNLNYLPISRLATHTHVNSNPRYKSLCFHCISCKWVWLHISFPNKAWTFALLILRKMST